MQAVNKRTAADLPEDQPIAKRACTEADRFKNICANLLVKNDVNELIKTKEQLEHLRPNLNGLLQQKCAKKIELVSNLISNPSFKVISEQEELQMNSHILAANSKLIRTLLSHQEGELNLSNFSQEAIDHSLMLIKYNQMSNNFKVAVNMLKVVDFLNAKKIVEVVENFLAVKLTDDLTLSLEDLTDLYNFTAEHPKFFELKFKTELHISNILSSTFKSNDFLKFQTIKSHLKENILPFYFRASSLDPKHLFLLKNMPLNGLILCQCCWSPSFWNTLQTLNFSENLNSLYLLDLQLEVPMKDVLNGIREIFPKLETFSLRSNDLKSEDLFLLPINLKKLNLEKNPHISGIGFQHFSSMDQLIEVKLSGCNLIDADIQSLPLQLPVLNLNLNKNLGRLSCQHISQMPKLHSLNLAGCSSLTDGDLQKLPTGLNKLILHGMPNLSMLSCQHFAKMSNLELLWLGACPLLTDAHIQQLPLHLKDLHLEGNIGIGRASCHHIIKMTNLRRLDITGCTGLKAEDIKFIKENLPKCKVISS